MAEIQSRLNGVDAARGLAIWGVMVFHTVWDLRFLGFTQFHPFWDPFWIALAKVLVNAFLFLVGVSLVLAHGQTMHWRNFWRRWLILAACAGAVSLITFLAFGEGFVYFGVLHAIAVFSLLAIPFLRAPLWLLMLVAAAFILPPLFYSDPFFNAKIYSWIGFWTQHPNTQDLVPIFNGFGTVVAGIVIMRLVARSQGILDALSWNSDFGAWRFLVWSGRKSLLLYLLHQPLVFGALYLVALMVAPA